MKFLVDRSLGGLAKWLRLCGFDTSAIPLIPGRSGLPAPTPGTFMLTRRESFKLTPRPDVLFLSAADSESQLEEVVRRLQIAARDFKPLSRCSHCNEPLLPLNRDQAQGRVPEYVFHRHRQFYECPRCQRIFWPGSHLPGITKTLGALLENPAQEP